MKRIFCLALLSAFLSIPAFASWYYNEDGGIGAYQPDGWQTEHNGRSSQLKGPAEASGQTTIFFGSDWVSHVGTQAELKAHMEEEQGTPATPVHFSDLDGFRTGTADHGAIYLLRQNENVIVIEFDIRGSRAQRDEAHTVLQSIEVRTGGISYPKL